MNYKVGSMVRQKTFDGRNRIVIITAKVPMIKNGRDGFDGYIVGNPDATVWGYDYQITKVLKK